MGRDRGEETEGKDIGRRDKRETERKRQRGTDIEEETNGEMEGKRQWGDT
jgi:hypothetical protein